MFSPLSGSFLIIKSPVEPLRFSGEATTPFECLSSVASDAGAAVAPFMETSSVDFLVFSFRALSILEGESLILVESCIDGMYMYVIKVWECRPSLTNQQHPQPHYLTHSSTWITSHNTSLTISPTQPPTKSVYYYIAG